MDTLLNYFEQDEHEASIHAQEILAGTDPIVDDDNDDNDDIPTTVAKKRNSRKKFDGPKFADLYPPVQGKICAPSVEAKLHGTWSKWAEYCEFSSYPGEPWAATTFGLNLFPNGSDINNPNNWDRKRTDGFFSWLDDNKEAKTVVKNAKTFLNIHLQCEYFCRLYATTGYGSMVTFRVGESLTVKNISRAVNARTAQAAMENCADIQADLDQLLSASKVREILLSALQPKEGGLVSRLNPTNALIFCCMYTCLSQTSRRGEELYGQRLIQRLTVKLSEIGVFGTTASVIVTNKAKHNQEGWLEYTTMLPHMDPIRDTAAWHGLLLVWRLLVSHEVFPQFTGNDDYNSIYKVHTYPSVKDPRVHVSSKQCSDVFKSFFLDNDAVCAKLVHQPRFQAIQEMDRSGIHESEWIRMSGHKGREAKVHTRSYAHNPPSKCLVQRGGGDSHDIRSFYPNHFVPSPREQLWLDEIVQHLIPKIVKEHEQVCHEYASTINHQARLAKRLTTIKGMLGSAKNDVEHMVMMMASPLVNPDTYLLDPSDTRSLWEIYRGDVFCTVLSLPAFTLEAFGKLQCSILEKMKDRHDYASSLSRESKCAMEKYIKENVTRPLFIQQQENRAVIQQLQQQQAIMMQCVMKQEHSSFNTVTPDKPPGGWISRVPASAPRTPHTKATLADGRTPRKRKAEVTQIVAISDEYKRREQAGELDLEPIELLCDKGLITLDDYWAKYKCKWKPLEESTGGEWRKDFVSNRDGKVKRGRSAWWTQRVGMFKVIEHHMEKGLSEDDAVALARNIYESVCKIPGRKPAIKDINVAFKSEMDRLEIKVTGRPKGSAKKSRKQRADSGGEFSDAFAMNAQMQLYYEQANLESEQEHFILEQERQQAHAAQVQEKQQLQWEHVHRYNAGPTPPMPCGGYNGTLHALPFRSVPGQANPPLPPGHSYASLS